MKVVSVEDNIAIILAHIHNRLADLIAVVSGNLYDESSYIKVDLEKLMFDFSEVQDDFEREDENAG